MILQPRICAVITENDPALLETAGPQADLFEVRIDLIGDGWKDLVKKLTKPWIACNRHPAEGGGWTGTEGDRIRTLGEAAELGANIVDLELRTTRLAAVVKLFKGQAECLISYHDLQASPTPAVMRKIIERERDAGADICKLVVTARSFQDNIEVLKMNSLLPVRTVAFAMGPLGVPSRILCPLAGGDFTYASIREGKESAAGQLTVSSLRGLYGILRNGQ